MKTNFKLLLMIVSFALFSHQISAMGAPRNLFGAVPGNNQGILDQVDFTRTEVNGNNAVHFWALRGNTLVLRGFLDRDGVDYSVRNNDGETPLHIGARGSWAVVNFLIGIKEVDINVQDKNGNTPLHIAAGGGHLEIVKLLLCLNRIEKNRKNNDGKTPAQLAQDSKALDCLAILTRGNRVKSARKRDRGTFNADWRKKTKKARTE